MSNLERVFNGFFRSLEFFDTSPQIQSDEIKAILNNKDKLVELYKVIDVERKHYETSNEKTPVAFDNGEIVRL